MIITFCGHSDYLYTSEDKEKLKKILLEKISENPLCKFYLGGYGNFDDLCLLTLKELQKDFPNIELIFITPYISPNYSKLKYAKKNYDTILFPSLEKTPLRFSILQRNKWMIDNADFVVAFVIYPFGGAAKTLEYAIKKNVLFLNIAKTT